MNKLIFIITATTVLLSSCRKDPAVEGIGDETCPDFEQTSDSYDELVITAETHDVLFQKTWTTDGPHIDEFVDCNCDGSGDFKISSTSDFDYYDGFTISQSSLTFQPSVGELFVYTETVNDTTYSYNQDDTTGNSIMHTALTTSHYQEGAIENGVNNNTYVKGFNLGDTIRSNHFSWSAASIKMLSHYENQNSWFFGADTNGYYHEAYQGTIYDRGIVNQGEYIAVKYVGEKGTKLGYIKFYAYTSGSHPYFKFEYMRMHR
jgi:hypothetical protein